ncbi:M28 family peptidase [bacterium]|nr:M28 family peptidase [bacterium]
MNHNLHRILPYLALMLLAAQAAAQPRMLTTEIQSGMQQLSADTVLRHAAELASDSMKGRGTGTAGARRAAAYLRAQLRQYGVAPAVKDTSYFQTFPLHGAEPLPTSSLTLYYGDKVQRLLLGRDYTLFKSGAQTFIPRPIRLVFVGYGIVAPEYDYNDYQNVNVDNAIVVYLSGEPVSKDENYFLGAQPTLYSIPEMKQRIALSRGARGSIMLTQPREERGYAWRDWQRIFAFEDISLPITTPAHLSVLLRFDLGGLLFEDSPYTLDDVVRMDAEGAMRSFPLKSRARFSGKFRERDFLAHNVAGLLRGSDPLLRDSWVVVSAHYDHLGVGPVVEGDSIYNGFVDNALGSAALLELARVMMKGNVRPRRSILFLFVTGEEKGLLGSQYYCRHPLVPLQNTIANLNVDGLAIFDTFDDIVGVGAEYSTLKQHLERLAAELQLTVSPIPPGFDVMEAFSSSDQISFAQAGVPSILIMEGSRYRNMSEEEGRVRFLRWGEEHYHLPGDDALQPVDTAAVRQHMDILFAYLCGIANTYEPPQWVSGSRFINARLRSLAEER